jgi:hypothetical protein
VFVTEFAIPTTVSTGEPLTPVSVSVTPGVITRDSRPCWAQTIWLSAAGQCPDSSVRSSTGPPGELRPVSVSGSPALPGTPGMFTSAVTEVCGNGPADAVTPDSRVVAASSAADTDGATSAVTSAPRCTTNA